MENLQIDHGWVERVEQNMKQVVANSDLAQTHYVTMLQELGRLDQGATATNDKIPNIEDVVAQLIELPQCKFIYDSDWELTAMLNTFQWC